MENETIENKITVHEQDMGQILEPKKGLFSGGTLSKIVPVIIFIAIIGWNINIYLEGKKADEFIKIYNPNITSIISNLGEVEENFLEIGAYANLPENLTIENLAEIQEALSHTESLMEKNTELFQNIKETVEILEIQACPQLKHSKQQCLDFVLAYKDMIISFEENDYVTANEIALSTVSKSEIFKSAVKKDNIEFQ